MIRLIPTGGDYGNIADGGTYESSKNLWVLGNYSLFVRPGYHRVDLNIPEGDKNSLVLLISLLRKISW